MIVSCIWAGASGKNNNSLLWARIFQGVALAPFEALVNACVGDLYFVHVSWFFYIFIFFRKPWIQMLETELIIM